MLVAAWRYNKAYSESSDSGNPYADKLEDMVLDPDTGLIAGIIAGTLTLLDVTDQGPAVEGTLVFYPDDTVGIENTEEAARFTMGKVF